MSTTKRNKEGQLLEFQNLVSDTESLSLIVNKVNVFLVEKYRYIDPIELISENERQNIVDVMVRSDSASFGIYNYDSVSRKLAFILYRLTKAHFLVNGNKRTACLIFVTLFAVVNKGANDLSKKLDQIETEAADRAIYISESSATDADEVMRNLEGWIEKITINLYL